MEAGKTDKQTNTQKLTCRSSANFVSAGQKYSTKIEFISQIGKSKQYQSIIVIIVIIISQQV